MNRNQQNQGMWNPYGVQGFQFLPPENGDRTGEMPSSIPLMNPLLSPMMVRGSAPYTQFSVNGPYGPLQFQGFPVGGQNALNVNDMNQLSEMNPEMNPEMMNMIQWGQQQGLQPVIYPMMMMVPLNQAQMHQQFPDVVEDGAQDEFLDAVSDFPYDTRSDHDVTPDLVRATAEAEPTYMNEDNQQTIEKEQPSYANDPGNDEVTSSGVQSQKPVSTVHQASSLRRGATSVHNFGEEEPRIRNTTRAQSVQPGRRSKEYDLVSRKEKFKTYSYNRSKQANRSYTLSRTQSTVSNFQPSERPPTVLHIPDIKPRLRKDEDHSSTQSLFPAVLKSNLRGMRNMLGLSLSNLKSALVGSNTDSVWTPQPALTPRRPARRKQRDVSRESRVGLSNTEDIIEEVSTPDVTPVLQRPVHPAQAVPFVPMPGVPVPTPAVNSLELIGSPVLQRSSNHSQVPVVKMPGAPDQDSVKLRSQPGRQLSADRNRFSDQQPAVPQPMGSSKLRRSTRFSAASLNSGSQFHSVISNISIRTDDIGPNNRVSVDSSATLVSDASFKQEQEKEEKTEKGREGDYDLVPVPRLAADQDFLRVERERKEQSKTPVSEKSETENLMSETREDLLQGIRAMDDSIQTLKAEMSKLMSVYEHVVLKPPEQEVVLTHPPDITKDECQTEEVLISQGLNPREISSISEAGQSVLEVVGNEAVIRFKNFQSASQEEEEEEEREEEGENMTVSATIKLPEKAESVYNFELGVYHENELENQITLSPKPLKKTLKHKNRMNKTKTFRKSFLGIETLNDEQLDAKFDDSRSGDYSEVEDRCTSQEQGNEQDVLGTKEHEDKSEDEKTYEEEEEEQEEGEEDARTIQDFLDETETIGNPDMQEDEMFDEFMTKSGGTVRTWEDLHNLAVERDIPPPLLLQENIRSLKLDLLSSIFQGLYPTEGDCQMVRHFISCPASLEEKYHMMRLADLLKRNKKDGVSLETLAEAMCQLARIGSELMKGEGDRDPIWRSIPCVKEIQVQKGITERAPWEKIQGGSEILESLGYTEYTGFALQYPRNIVPDMFADHIGNLSVELVLAAAEVTSLLERKQPTLLSLHRLLAVQPFPGAEPQTYYPDVPLLEEKPPPRTTSTLGTWIKKPSPPVSGDEDELEPPIMDSHIYDDEGSTMNVPKFSRVFTESEYEEIGPPRHRPGGAQHPCDLCGSPNALLSCAQCHNQAFCAACDDMYHKHPKRTDHVRKSLKNAPAHTGPAVEMPGSGPKAPPRRNTRRSGGLSAEPSPAPSRTASRSGTLQRQPSLPASIQPVNLQPVSLQPVTQPGHPMAGRPLPPPPPVPVQTGTPPPILPKKSASLAQMSTLNRPRPTPQSIPMPGAGRPTATEGGGGDGQPSRTASTREQWSSPNMAYPKKISNSSQYPSMYPAQGSMYPKSSNGYPSNNNGYPSNNNIYPNKASGYPGGMIYPHTKYPPNQQYPLTSAGPSYPTAQQITNAAYPGSSLQLAGFPAQTGYPSFGGKLEMPRGEVPPGGIGDWNGNGWAAAGPSNYHEDISFPPQPSEDYPPGGAGAKGSRRSSRGVTKGRFANRVNRSSSLHDLARARLDPSMESSEGVRWRDEMANAPGYPNPSLGFQRATSTKSLHMLGGGEGRMWNNNNNMWSNSNIPFNIQQGQFPPIVPGWGGMPAMPGMLGVGLNRSMHELNKAYLRPSSPSESQKSSRSKKSNRSGNSRRSKSTRHKERTRHNSSSQSRNASRNASRNSKKTRGGDRDRSASTDSDDFFTGESDEEFVSLSSHSDKSPRASWTCEHCTYMNNPGVRVCTMCSRTTKLALRDEKAAKKEKVRKPRKKFDSSDSEVERKEKRREEGGKKERRRDEGEKKEKRREKKNYSDSDSDEEKGRRRREKEKEKKGKKKLSESNESDIDDAIATYYAVRMDKNKGMSMNPVYADSSSESTGNPKSIKRPNPDAPAPAKGILKKASSNPSLNKLEAGSEMGGPISEAGGTISEVGYITNKLTERLKARGALMSPKPKEESRWVEENWTRQKEELKAWAQNQGNQSYRSEHIPQHGHLNGGVDERLDSRMDGRMDGRMEGYLEGRLDERMEGRMEGKMYRTLSGHSLAEPELMAQNFARRGSEQVNGKRNFRSKRFSRNLEPSLKRAQSFHMDQRLDGDNWMDQQRRTFYRANSKNSINSEHMGGPAESYLAGQTDSSDVEEPVTFMSTVTSSTRGPGGIGSYLSRREFGSSEVQPGPDSGYVSHSSGGGYPKLQVQNQNKNTIKSFTLSMDRGFAHPPNLKSGMSGSISDFARFRSMEDLTVAKKESNSSIQLVQILRDAEEYGFSSVDIQVAAVHCGSGNPVDWLNENWGNMIETVMTLASNVGHEAEENTVGTISKLEAREALRANKGNIWVAVTDCVETRQKKYDDLMSRGKFSREDAVTMLTAHQGDTEAAFQELNKSQLKTFLQRIRAGPQGDPANQEELEDFEDATSEAEIEELEPEVDQGEEEEKVVDHIVHEVVPPEQLQLERQVRRLLAEQKVKSFQQGELILRLIDEGFPEDECLLAAEEASKTAGEASKAADAGGTAEDLNAVADFNTALNLLKRDCELCATQMNIKQVVRMVGCEHCCCSTCATNFFSILIKDKNISQAVCPFCAEPSDLQDDDVALQYFAKLDILLKDILEKDVHDLFQRKLRDRTLAKDPNFKWCYKCPFGFLADPKNKKLVCPDCRAMSCAKCLAPWEPTHEGITCQDFARWKEENDPDHQAAGLEQHLAQHGISCPACNFRYTLTKGGCMHFTCTQCKFEFCIGCKRPFKLGTRCGKDPGCAKLGLHAHHPRNCLFYLRDKEPEDLRKLLKKNKVEFDATGEAVECGVQVQKESDAGLQDGVCGEMAEQGHAGLCRIHYVEYLCEKIVENKLEVVSLLELGEVKAVFSRAGKFLPKQRPGEYEFQYLRRLIQVVQEEIPLETA